MLIYHASKYRSTSSPWAIMLALNNNYTTSSGRMHIQCYSRGERERLKYGIEEGKWADEYWAVSGQAGVLIRTAFLIRNGLFLCTFKDATHKRRSTSHQCQYHRAGSSAGEKKWPAKVIYTLMAQEKRTPTHMRYFSGTTHRSHMERNLQGCIKTLSVKEHLHGTKASNNGKS